MQNYIRVGVVFSTNEMGQIMPSVIHWTDGKDYPISRILHVYYPDDMVEAYIVLIGQSQYRLLFNGLEWRLSKA